MLVAEEMQLWDEQVCCDPAQAVLEQRNVSPAAGLEQQVLSLLALLVHKFKY